MRKIAIAIVAAFVMGVIMTAGGVDIASASESGVLYTKWVQAPLGQLMSYSDLRSATEEVKTKVEEFKEQGLHVGVIKTSYASRGETGSEARGGESHREDSTLSNRRQAQSENVLNEVGVNGLCPIFTSPTFGPTGKRGVEFKIILLSAASANGITKEQLDEALATFTKALEALEKKTVEDAKALKNEMMDDAEKLIKKYDRRAHFLVGPSVLGVASEHASFGMVGGEMSLRFQYFRSDFGLYYGGSGLPDWGMDLRIGAGIPIDFGEPGGWSLILLPQGFYDHYSIDVDESNDIGAAWDGGGISLGTDIHYTTTGGGFAFGIIPRVGCGYYRIVEAIAPRSADPNKTTEILERLGVPLSLSFQLGF